MLWIYSSSTSYFTVLTQSRQVNKLAGMVTLRDSHKDVTKETAIRTAMMMMTTTKKWYPNWKIASHKSKTDITVNTLTIMPIFFLCDCLQIKIILRSSHMTFGCKYWLEWMEKFVFSVHCTHCVHAAWLVHIFADTLITIPYRSNIMYIFL